MPRSPRSRRRGGPISRPCPRRLKPVHWLAAMEPHTRAGGAVNDLNGFAHAEHNDENERLLTNLLP